MSRDFHLDDADGFDNTIESPPNTDVRRSPDPPKERFEFETVMLPLPHDSDETVH
jgi:hypothetical protein